MQHGSKITPLRTLVASLAGPVKRATAVSAIALASRFLKQQRRETVGACGFHAIMPI